jgi:hypothetical protein
MQRHEWNSSASILWIGNIAAAGDGRNWFYSRDFAGD